MSSSTILLSATWATLLSTTVQASPVLAYQSRSETSSASSQLPVYAIIFIIIVCIAVAAGITWLVLNHNILGFKSLTGHEERAVTAAVQQALEQWHQESSERRMRARAEVPKPVKLNMDDIDTVVLDQDNKDHILTRSLAISLPNTASSVGVVAIDDAEKDDNESPAATIAHARTLVGTATGATARPDQDASASHECCSICIEEFEVGDSVHVLPVCRHVFHVACIDPWLTTTSALCPLCKTDTRTSEELTEYNRRLAAANASLQASAAVPTNISHGVCAIFDQIVDEICLARLGYVIRRHRPMKISAADRDDGLTAVFFETTVFIREEDEEAPSNKGFLARFVYGISKRFKHHDVQVTVRRTWAQPSATISRTRAQRDVAVSRTWAQPDGTILQNLYPPQMAVTSPPGMFAGG